MRIPVIILLVLLTQSLAAQQLTLDTAILIALQNNPGLKIAQNNVNIAGINNSYSIAGGLPIINATSNVTEQVTSLEQKYSNPLNNKSSTNASSNNINAGLAAAMPVFEGFRVQTAKQRLAVLEAQSKQIYSSRAQLLIYNVMLKYYDIVRQQGYARTLEASIRASQQKLEIVKQQQAVGVANDADLFQSQVDLNTLVQSLQAQQLVVDQDKTDLLTLLILNPDSVVTVKDTIIVNQNIKLDSILSAAYVNPDIQAALDQIRINQYLEKEIGSYRYPSASVNLGYNFSRNINPQGFNTLNQAYGPYVGFGLTIPIFNGGVYKRQQEIAGINVNNAKLQKDTLMLSIQSTAVKNYQAYQSNLKQLETAKKNYDLSSKLLNLVLMRFQYKVATIVDVILAQQSFENAGFQLVNISYAAKAAEIQLRRLANHLP